MSRLTKSDAKRAGQAAKGRQALAATDSLGCWARYERKHAGYMSLLPAKELKALQKAFCEGWEKGEED